jgi:ribosome-associated protein
MQRQRLEVGDRPINLTQVLKLAGWAENGGQAKAFIAEGRVQVNGEVEYRKRRQMNIGDTVQLQGGPPIVLQ